ncbi:MAG TPA: hypothetical protein VK966_13265 [Longimicrobiales bacterium]|nr:hypothetical protein [Longimicrobiales bacterium]
MPSTGATFLPMSEPSPRIESLGVTRTARYAVLGRPESAPELWVALHGYGQLAERFIRRFQALPGIGERRAVVAPEALNRFYVENTRGSHGPGSRVGATWMTRHDRDNEVRDYVFYLDALLDRVRPGAAAHVLLGFSQGAETASRWAVLGATRPATLILWGGGVAEDLAPETLRARLEHTRVVLVTGDEDPWGRKRSGETLALLRDLGLAPERVEFPGGHRLNADVLRDLALAGSGG